MYKDLWRAAIPSLPHGSDEEPKKLTDEGKLAAVQNQVNDIETYRKVVLNPLAHEHPTTLTTVELQGAIDAIEALDTALS